MTETLSTSRVARCVMYLGLSFFVALLIEEGKLTLIVHPRMTPWIIVAAFLFLVLAISEFYRLFKRLRRSDPFSFYYPFLFVIAITFLFVQSTTLNARQSQSIPEKKAFQAAVLAQHSNARNKAESMPLPEWITMNDDMYWSIYNRLYDDPTAVRGKRITVQGYVYHNKAFSPQKALIGRNLMWCCSADMTVIGYLVEGPAVAQFKENTWVEVTGTLESIKFDVSGDGKATLIPLIKTDSIKQVEKAFSSTIFPY